MMSKRKGTPDKEQRSCRPRAAGELLGDVGGTSFRRFGFVQGAIVSRWSEIVGERYAKVSSPESIRFPAGRKSSGALTLLVEGAHAPLIQHLTPMIVERVNRFFGYAAIDRIVFRQGKLPAATPMPRRPELRAVPKEIGEGLREIADPELRACLESLATQIAATSGPPSLPMDGETAIPVINRSKSVR
ncbi:DciA family protein [Sphingomonas lutea]